MVNQERVRIILAILIRYDQHMYALLRQRFIIIRFGRWMRRRLIILSGNNPSILFDFELQILDNPLLKAGQRERDPADLACVRVLINAVIIIREFIYPADTPRAVRASDIRLSVFPSVA